MLLILKLVRLTLILVFVAYFSTSTLSSSLYITINACVLSVGHYHSFYEDLSSVLMMQFRILSAFLNIISTALVEHNFAHTRKINHYILVNGT